MSTSSNVGGQTRAFSVELLYRRRKLQHAAALAFDEVVQENDGAVGELQSVVVLIVLVLVDLAEARDTRGHLAFFDRTVVLVEERDILLEGDLGTGTKADGHVLHAFGIKAFGRGGTAILVHNRATDQFIRDLSVAGVARTQAVVAHGRAPHLRRGCGEALSEGAA